MAEQAVSRPRGTSRRRRDQHSMPVIDSRKESPDGSCRPLGRAAGWLAFAAIFLSNGLPAAAQNAGSTNLAPGVLTNIYQIWTLPRDVRSMPNRIQTEMVVYFFDSEWNNAWGECQGVPAWLPIADSPTPLKPGQRLAIDGVILPMRERFDWSRTRV